MPDLTRDQVLAIRDGELAMDALIREHIHANFSYRFADAASYAEAIAIETAIKAGSLGRAPQLNPARGR